MRQKITGEFTEISLSSGTLQNVSNYRKIEVASSGTKNSGIVLRPLEKIQIDSEVTLYIRAVGTSETLGSAYIAIEPFKFSGGRGDGGNAVTYSEMVAATAEANGKAGLVPAPASGKQNAFLRGDGTWAVPSDSDTMYSVFVKSGSGAKAGLVPAPSTTAGTIKYLREDGTWAVPPDNDTTYNEMEAATANAAGQAGLVPAPAAGKQNAFLRGDGTWAMPPNDDTTYSDFVKSGSGAKAGLVPAPPTTAGTTKYLREDGTWSVPPDNDTTYNNMAAATANAAGQAGLVPAPAAGKQTAFLRGDGTWAMPPNDNTTYSDFVKSGSGAKSGLVPSPGTTAGTTKYLCEDGTWSVPPNNNTDTKVTNTVDNTTKAYLTGTTNASTNTDTQVFDTGVYLTTTAGMLHVGQLELASGIVLT